MPSKPFRSLKWIASVAQRELVVLLAICSVSACLWIFVRVTQEVLENDHRGIDNRILLALRKSDNLSTPIGPTWVKTASLDISSLGSAPVLTLFTVIICGYLLLERKPGAAGMVLFAALSGMMLSMALKALIVRERPQVVPHLAEISNWSYPSGHSMAASIIYLTLAVMLAKTIENRTTKLYVIGVALFLAFLVGLTRLIIGVHYPSDVLAGWTAGTAWAIICWLAANWIVRTRKRHIV